MCSINFKGAIFDFDGTMVDSMWIWEALLNRCLTDYGFAKDDSLILAVKNMTFNQSAGFIIEHFSMDITVEQLHKEWYKILYGIYVNEIKLKPDLKEYLEALHKAKIPLAIATSNFKPICEASLKANGVFDLFSAIVTSDEVGKNKENPDVYLAAAERIGVSPSECMVFEDILIGIKSAKKANMLTTAVYDEVSANDVDEIKKIADRFIVEYGELEV